MNKHLKYKTVDVYGKEIELTISKLDNNFITLKVSEKDNKLNYNTFAEFMAKANQYLKDKRFK